ncbi:MAG TPA: sugar transferase [Thermoleophilaceae bacterium]|nr:sugar transferase [Thermoleophilaceae bacterium]
MPAPANHPSHLPSERPEPARLEGLTLERDGPRLAPPRRNALYRRLLAVADVLSAALALLVGVVLLGDDAFKVEVLAFTPLVVVVGKAAGLYDRDEHLIRKTTLDEAPMLFRVATATALVVWLAAGAVIEGSLGKEQVGALWGLLFASMLGARALARRLVNAVAAPERCLVVGDGLAARRIEESFDSSPAVNASIVGRVPLHHEADVGGPPVLGDLFALDEVVIENRIERVIICPPERSSEEFLDVVRQVKALGVGVSVVPRLLDVVRSSVEFDHVEGVTLLGLRRRGLTHSSQLLKRAIDLVGGTVALMVLAPVMAVVAIALRVRGRRPVLLRSTRVGMRGSTYQLLSFNTSFRSLQTLPQLFNVVRGQMSLVGTRPFTPEQADLLEFGAPTLPPGITGLWHTVAPADRQPLDTAELDFFYGANWSVWLDVKIIGRTIQRGLARGRSGTTDSRRPTGSRAAIAANFENRMYAGRAGRGTRSEAESRDLRLAKDGNRDLG